MTQPLLGLTVGVRDAYDRARQFGVDFLDLHFGGREDGLLPVLDKCETHNVKYVLNFEGAPLEWTPSYDLKCSVAGRNGFLGFLMDEADHMQINSHWPVIDYYGYNDRHYLAETDGLDLLAARQAVFAALQKRNQAYHVAGKSAAVEFLFPVMMHTAARAGLNVSPKIL